MSWRITAALAVLRVRSPSINAAIISAPVGFTQHMLEHLSRRRARERRDDIDAGRTLEPGQSLPHKTDHIVLVYLDPGSGHDDRFHGLAPALVRHADNGDLGQLGMGRENILDFDRID